MAAGNSVVLTFAGDSKSLERTFSNVGAGAKDMSRDLESASSKSERAIKGLNDTVGASESKFMGAADLADGLSTSLGLNLGPAIDMSRAFGDMAGGFDALVGPALEKMTAKLKASALATKAQSIATTILNTVMRANPILLAVTALAALTAGFIIAYKKSETFRNIVQGAMGAARAAIGWVGDKAEWLGQKIAGVVTGAAKKLARIADIITTPYQLAFRAIASLWNNTVGRLSFSIPGWVPGIGGSGFDVPDIPMLANGGIARGGKPHIVGERGPELFVPGMTGTVVPNHALGSGGQLVVSVAPGAGQDLLKLLRFELRTSGGTL